MTEQERCVTCRRWEPTGLYQKRGEFWGTCALTITDDTGGPVVPTSLAQVRGYEGGHLETRAEFGCVQWAPRESTP